MTPSPKMLQGIAVIDGKKRLVTCLHDSTSMYRWPHQTKSRRGGREEQAYTFFAVYWPDAELIAKNGVLCSTMEEFIKEDLQCVDTKK